jgi:gas vesicle protein
MDMQQSENGFNVGLLGVLAGFVGGAIVALLFAPSSGRQTREHIASGVRHGRDRLRESMKEGTELVEEGRAAMNRGLEVMSDAIAQGRDAYQRVNAGESA